MRTILGDTGAGKSSFINLLLETDILPVYAIEATQTICELRKSRNGEKEAICYYRRDSSRKPRAPEIIKIDGARGMEDLKNRIKETDHDEESPYERIEIYMPFRMLEVSIKEKEGKIGLFIMYYELFLYVGFVKLWKKLLKYFHVFQSWMV